jgi:hypothetical protein
MPADKRFSLHCCRQLLQECRTLRNFPANPALAAIEPAGGGQYGVDRLSSGLPSPVSGAAAAYAAANVTTARDLSPISAALAA